jgi:SNF2 family DNA or RNA helicase
METSHYQWARNVGTRHDLASIMMLITSRFVHRITKTRSAVRPVEKGGGILADEMGMGKTLSILALVINTVKGGHEWAENCRQEELAQSHIHQHSHSTLIIAPSGCELIWASSTSVANLVYQG